VRIVTLFLLLCTFSVSAQLPLDESQFIARLKTGALLPEKLLSTRTVVFYTYTMTMKELEAIQKSFNRTGIDAVVYLESDLVGCGRDVSVSLASYLNAREISNIALIQKSQAGYVLYFTEYNKKANLVEQDQSAWTIKNTALDVLLMDVYRIAANTLKRENMLINEYPELDMPLNPISGKRSDLYAIDLKADLLAVPKWGNEADDKALEEIMKLYPYKYKLTEAGLSENELRKQGYLFVLRFIRTRDKLAKNVLGYDMTKSQSSIVSVAYTENSIEPQLKNIPANTVVYKFYFKHIDSGNVFLGTKWDADEAWQQALLNQLKGFKVEFKIP
jgi:hypothetical protein